MPLTPKLEIEEITTKVLQKISGQPRLTGVTPKPSWAAEAGVIS